jgi:hypothetical protein
VSGRLWLQNRAFWLQPSRVADADSGRAAKQTLGALVRDELRGPIAELVRWLVPELVAEQLNGKTELTGPSTVVFDPSNFPTRSRRVRV